MIRRVPFDPQSVATTDLETLGETLTNIWGCTLPRPRFETPLEAKCAATNTAAVLAAGIIPLLSSDVWKAQELPLPLPPDSAEIALAKTNCANVLLTEKITPERKTIAIASVKFGAALLQVQGFPEPAKEILTWLKTTVTTEEFETLSEETVGMAQKTSELLAIAKNRRELYQQLYPNSFAATSDLPVKRNYLSSITFSDHPEIFGNAARHASAPLPALPQFPDTSTPANLSLGLGMAAMLGAAFKKTKSQLTEKLYNLRSLKKPAIEKKPPVCETKQTPPPSITLAQDERAKVATEYNKATALLLKEFEQIGIIERRNQITHTRNAHGWNL